MILHLWDAALLLLLLLLFCLVLHIVNAFVCYWIEFLFVAMLFFLYIKSQTITTIKNLLKKQNIWYFEIEWMIDTWTDWLTDAWSRSVHKLMQTLNENELNATQIENNWNTFLSPINCTRWCYSTSTIIKYAMHTIVCWSSCPDSRKPSYCSSIIKIDWLLLTIHFLNDKHRKIGQKVIDQIWLSLGEFFSFGVFFSNWQAICILL